MSEPVEVRLGDLIQKERPITYGIVQPGPDVSPDGVPLIRGKDYSNGTVSTEGLYHVLPEIDRPYSRSKVKQDDILLSIVGYVGKVAVVPDELEAANITQTTARLSVDARIALPRYVYHALNSPVFATEIRRFEKGSAQPGLNLADVGKFRVLLIRNRGEQKKVTRIIDVIDQTIEKTEALIEKYQQIKAGLMHDLFTRGIGADGKLRPPREQAPELYQESPIGWIPKEWQYELLDKLAQRASGHTPNKNIPSYWNGGIKWVSLADSNKLDRLYVYDTKLEISQLGIQNSSAVLHPTGTVVITRDAGVGKSAILAESMAVSQHFMAWICREKIDNHFLYHWLQHNKRTFENVAMGSTIVTIGLPFFKKLRLAAPVSIEEQREIGKRITTADEQVFALETELAKSRELKSGLMHDLLTGEVQVNPDPSEAPDEL